MMLKKIEIINFKAHETLLIDLDNASNILIYGENGSGKSSIYEAIKLNYFKNKILDTSSLPTDPAQRRAKVDEIFNSYNKQNTGSFELKFNGVGFEKTADLVTNNMNAFMLNLQSSTPTSLSNGTVNINSLLEREFLSLNLDNIDAELIETQVNTVLPEFHEVFKIRIDANGDIRFVDTSRNLDDKRLVRFFNEGKVNLALLLIYFKLIKHYKSSNESNLLVLDDFITSLDMPNRTLLVNYILREFSEFQVFIFTHNVYFYNLIRYLVNDVSSVGDKWAFYNLYESKDSTVLYKNSDRLCINKLSEDLDRLGVNGETDNFSYQSLGNNVRKKLERILYEFSKLFSIGAVEETNKILESLLNNNVQILDLKKLLEIASQDEINVTEINDLKVRDFGLIQKNLRELKSYQKVMMHPLSHSTDYGDPSYSEKEIKTAIELIKKIEPKLKDLINKKVEGA